MQTLDQISMKFETWAIFMSLYGMVCQKDIGSISPYPWGISANPFNPLNPAGQFSGLHKGVSQTRRAGIPAFSLVCQKPDQPLNRLT